MDYFLVLVVVLLMLYFYPSIKAYWQAKMAPAPAAKGPGLFNVPPSSAALAQSILAPVTAAAVAQNALSGQPNSDSNMMDGTSSDDPLSQYLLNHMQPPISGLYEPDYSPTEGNIKFITSMENNQDTQYQINSFKQMQDLATM